MRNTFLLIAGLMLVMACNNTGKLSRSGKMESHIDSVSYALGKDLAGQLSQVKTQGIELNFEALGAGLVAKMEEGEPKLDEATQQQLMMEFQRKMMEAQQAAQQQSLQQQQAATSGRTGQPAPDINLPTPDGANLSLSSLKGKVVLVDFWAAWCKPCRRENPNVVRIYNKYKDKGFEILGVSLDRTKDAWLKAIADDGLTWPQVSDLKFWQSEAAQTYGVSSIPYTVLVDRDGTIIAERLRGPSLEAKLAEIFGE
ncbi:redoxin domain-containing protein [Pontibacter sp. G13]|uniref:redoxin domain-containing protein n=1 Tax=Pontibacter sp. G13 TaxID=3074898 RepID=UPI0039066D80